MRERESEICILPTQIYTEKLSKRKKNEIKLKKRKKKDTTKQWIKKKKENVKKSFTLYIHTYTKTHTHTHILSWGVLFGFNCREITRYIQMGTIRISRAESSNEIIAIIITV